MLSHCAAAVLLAACSVATAADYVASTIIPPVLPREFRGAWVATVFNIDWPSKPGLPTATQQAELIALLDRARQLKLNAIILQVRPACDALYKSSLEPWSRFLTGEMGTPPNPFYDPLQFAVTEAHQRGLELHAWFNPYRALTSANDAASAGHITKTRPRLARRYGNQLWLDPGEPAVREHAVRVIMDVVKRYDIDGVHMDDYFYPYKVKNAAGEKVDFPDDPSWQDYTGSGGKLSRNDWRRDNVNNLVQKLYEEIKREKRWVKFGISPFGIWRPHVPPTIEAGLDAYDDLYADARLWFQKGWLDYLTPQLYWSIAPAKQSFPVLLDWWAAQNAQQKHLWPGISTASIGPKRTAQEVLNQIAITRAQTSVRGHVHWSMKSLMRDQGGIAAALGAAPYAERALVPASPWLGSAAPEKPKLSVGKGTIDWEPAGADKAAIWAVQLRTNNVWKMETVAGSRNELKFDANSPPDAIAVTGIDRNGNAGAVAVVEKSAR